MHRFRAVRSILAQADLFHHSSLLADNRPLADGTSFNRSIPEQIAVSSGDRIVHRAALDADLLPMQLDVLFDGTLNHVGADANCAFDHLALAYAQALVHDLDRVILAEEPGA